MSNVLLLSLFDNGNQMQHLAEALRKYTSHEAIHINIEQSYLDYTADVKLHELTDYKKFRELVDRINSCDFFVFSEIFPLDVKNVLERLQVYDKINPSNMIIRTAGSISRSRSDKYLKSWIDHNIMFAGPVYDWTIYRLIGRIAPIGQICPVGKIPKPNPPIDGVKICFSPTKHQKGATEFSWVINKLIDELVDGFSYAFVSGKSWEESLKIKSECNATFDQFLTPSYANNAIEGMYLNHVVFSKLSEWVFLTCPDIPIVNVQTKEDLYNAVKQVIENPEIINSIGEMGHEYVIKHHSPEHVAKQWSNLIDHVRQK